MEQQAHLEPGKYYHIFNRGINGANIFLEERNYAYFLNLYTNHVEPAAETFAYCLLRNHFHLLVRVKVPTETFEVVRTPTETFEVVRTPTETFEVVRTPTETFEVYETSKVLSATQAFANFFNSYAKGINKTYARTGSLFEHRFGRLEVTSESYCMRLIHYIHFNPQKHSFTTDFREYPYSSYRVLLADTPTKLCRAQILEWFGGRAAFDAVHQTLSDEKTIWSLIGEDLD